MATINLKNVPDHLLERLKSIASQERRSLNQQILHLLDSTLKGDADLRRLKSESERQTAVWRELLGQWRSQESVQEELGAIYGSRTAGRTVDL